MFEIVTQTMTRVTLQKHLFMIAEAGDADALAMLFTRDAPMGSFGSGLMMLGTSSDVSDKWVKIWENAKNANFVQRAVPTELIITQSAETLDKVLELTSIKFGPALVSFDEFLISKGRTSAFKAAESFMSAEDIESMRIRRKRLEQDALAMRLSRRKDEIVEQVAVNQQWGRF